MTAESFYSPEHRALQDAFDARALADTMEAMIVHPTLADVPPRSSSRVTSSSSPP